MSLKFYNIKVDVVDTAEVFTVKKVCNLTKIKDLKISLELISGIPSQLQRIMYLDQGDMVDESTLKHHDVVPNGQLKMHIWNSWLTLIQSCVAGQVSKFTLTGKELVLSAQWKSLKPKDVGCVALCQLLVRCKCGSPLFVVFLPCLHFTVDMKVMSLGVTPDSSFTNPNVQRMSLSDRQEYFASRCAVALYVACHRGQIIVIKSLLDAGANVSSATKYGRTALHVAAANGQLKVIDILLESNAGHLIHKRDFLNVTPLQTAYDTGHKACARKLFLFQWQKRATKMSRIPQSDITSLMAHQLFDSSSRTWLRGIQQQIYQSNILPPQEFQGTRINAKRSDYAFNKNRLKDRNLEKQPFLTLPPIKQKSCSKEKKQPILMKQLYREVDFEKHYIPTRITY